MPINRRIAQLLCAPVALLFTTTLLAETMIDNAWVREAPPNAKMLAGYMRIANSGSQAIDVIAVESPAFAAVEMHRSEMHDGVARMVQQDKLTVAPGAQLELAPGGYHLMLMNPQRQLREGDSVSLKLRLGDGSVVEVNAPVRKAVGQDHEHHHH